MYRKGYISKSRQKNYDNSFGDFSMQKSRPMGKNLPKFCHTDFEDFNCLNGLVKLTSGLRVIFIRIRLKRESRFDTALPPFKATANHFLEISLDHFRQMSPFPMG